MKVLTAKFIKVSMSMEEYTTINSMMNILDDIYYDDNEDTRKNIEKEWKKQGLNIGIDDVLIALEILRDLESKPLDTE